MRPLLAIVPLVPLFLLILGSKQVGLLPEISVPLSMLIGVALGFLVTWKDAQAICRKFFEGMGNAYADVIGLIVCASVFTTGMTAIGLTGALTELMEGSQTAAAAAGTFGPFFIAVISGSGDAAAFAFNGAITPLAAPRAALISPICLRSFTDRIINGICICACFQDTIV